jgi:phosphate transporter
MQQSRKVVELHASVSHKTAEQSEAQLQASRLTKTMLEYQRQTIWRDMVALERASHGPQGQVVEGDEAAAHKRRMRRNAVSAATVVLACLVFAGLLAADLFDSRQKNACFAMLVLLSILWCTEAIPLYVTSMLVPGLTVILHVLEDPEDGSSLPAPQAAHRVFSVRIVWPACSATCLQRDVSV